jgi:AAA+ superfamily predicted ATPase
MPIFQDSFLDNRHNWETRNDEHAYLRVGDGDFAYVIQQRRPVGSWPTWQPLEIGPDEYKIHAVIERVSGGNYGYGLLWRGPDENNCYSFQLSMHGYYQVRRCREGVWSGVQEWKKSEHIRAGRRAFNELLIVQLTDRAKFYINGELVDELIFSDEPTAGGFGFVVNGDVKIRVHNTIVLRHVEWEDDDKELGEFDQEALDDVMADLNELIGMDNIKQEISTLVNYLKVQKMRREREMATMPLSLHMVLGGPPGTGKTTVARLIGRIYKALGFLSKGHLVETDRAGLVAGYVGQTALRVDEMVNKAKGGVLFIDEAYALMPSDGYEGTDFGREAIETLLKRMEDMRGDLAVVIAGYADELHRFLDANPGVKSRFNRYLYFEHFNPDELVAIFELFATKAGLTLTPEASERIREIMTGAYNNRDRSFGNARFARNLLEKVVEEQANRLVTVDPVTDEDLATVTLDDIAALDDEIVF